MSHTTAIKSVLFVDQQALRAAIDELKNRGVNCELLENATPRAYYSDQEGMGLARFVIKLNDAKYDVGLYDSKEGKGMEARTDLYGGSVAKVLGVNPAKGESKEQAALGKLYSTYATHATMAEAARNGYAVQRIDNPDGSVQLRLSA